jgi:hypothetical protein
MKLMKCKITDFNHIKHDFANKGFVEMSDCEFRLKKI